MPNGVIWAGAVDGSNHVGAMVTCQAMTASPVGVCAAAKGTIARMKETAASRPARRCDRIRRSTSLLLRPSIRTSGPRADSLGDEIAREATKKAVFGSWGLRNARQLPLQRKERPLRVPLHEQPKQASLRRCARAKTYRRVGRRVKSTADRTDHLSSILLACTSLMARFERGVV